MWYPEGSAPAKRVSTYPAFIPDKTMLDVINEKKARGEWIPPQVIWDDAMREDAWNLYLEEVTRPSH